jgi:hypothetical protein
MPADSNIFQQYLQAPKSVLDYQAQYDQADARKNALQLSAMDLSEKTQANQRTQKVRNALEALGAGATDDARINALKATATPEGFAQADALDKSIQERAKTKAVTGKDEAETAAKKLDVSIKAHDFHVQQLGAVSDPQTAQQWAIAGLQSGVFTPEQFQRGYANIPSDPAGFEQWKQRAMQGGVAATEQLKMAQAKLIADNNNKTQVQTTGMNNATSRANNAATVGATIRGQDMTDARTRETTAAAITKPFEITGEDGKPVLVQQDKQGNIRPVQGYQPKQGASKPLNDTQAKALQFGSRMQASGEIIDQLAEKGVVASIPGSRGGYGIGSTINALQPADRQRLDQAKRDFINAVLRRESGAAISAGEFDNAEKQYFPQPGEKDPSILAQKKANRDLAMRGILAEVPDSENRVAKVRGTTAPAAAPGWSYIGTVK